MAKGIPGFLISRDGSVRKPVGSPNISCALFGRVHKQHSGIWVGICADCGRAWARKGRNTAAQTILDHWGGARIPAGTADGCGN